VQSSKISYVCEPSVIRIDATEIPQQRLLLVEMYVGRKLALKKTYSVALNMTGKEVLHRAVYMFCEHLMGMSENHIQDKVHEDLIMPCLSAWTTLRKVRKRSGGLVWSR